VIYVEGTSAGGTNGVDSDYFNPPNPNLANDDKWNPAFGNVFVSGYLTGQLTIAANNDIFITAYNPTLPWASTTYTGGIWYDSIGNFTPNLTTSNDLLGLIANEDTRILGSDWPDNSNTDLANGTYYTSVPDVNPNTVAYTSSHWGLTAADIYVQGAVMTVNGVFDAESWQGGPYATGSGTTYTGGTGIKGHLNLTGCYAMNYDGAFAVYGGNYPTATSHGYGEDDNYDPRLQYETPPHFLKPEYSGWEVINWHSVPDVIALTPATLPTAQGSYSITASGGTPPYSFYVGGTLPQGLSPPSITTDITTYTLTGPAAQGGTFSIIAADSKDYVGSQYYTLTTP
jgi:hypothetical protein